MSDTLLRPIFPFTALVAQTRMKRALILNAINPKLGGVLIRGEKGTAKSTAVRALANLLPELTLVADCPYGCDPTDPSVACESCRERHNPPTTTRRVPLVELPVGATEDRVVGTLDLEHAIQEGRRRFEPGLLASANRGILYVDEVNLLNDHLVDVLLDAAAMGMNYVEREGVSVAHPSQFILVGTMNPEEGDLRPQLLDRFALAVEVEGLPDPAARVDVVRRRIAFERDPAAFLAEWRDEELAERGRIQHARELLPEVRLDDRMLGLITQLCVDFEVDGLRADIVMYRAALTLAAYAGRRTVEEDDVRDAAELALLHRRRRLPFQQPQLDRDQLDQRIKDHLEDADNANQDPDDDEQDPPDGSPPEDAGPPPPDARLPNPGSQDQVIASGQQYAVKPLAAPADRRERREFRGRRSKAQGQSFVGHYVGARQPRERVRDLALDATLRAAAPYQRERRALVGAAPPSPPPLGGGNPSTPPSGGTDGLDPPRRGDKVGAARPAFLLKAYDLREKVRETRLGNLILFVVDASGSMAARERMAAAKGAVLSLLLDAYQKRDQVGLVAFRGPGAELLLSPTGSVELAQERLRELPTGGRTPLGHGLQLGLATFERHLSRGAERLPLLVLVSDGRANVSLHGGDPLEELPALGFELAKRRVHTVVVDTDESKVRLGFAADVAGALSADYLPIAQLAAGTLAGATRAAAWRRGGRA